MLVLSRKLDESIIIDGNIEVRFLGYDQGKARLGVIAPREIPVHRAEVHARIQTGEVRSPSALTAVTARVETLPAHDPRAEAL